MLAAIGLASIGATRAFGFWWADAVAALLVSVPADAISVELFDPVTGSWAATAGMNRARSLHTATLLPNGTVLVVGSGGPAGVYDPTIGSWAATAFFVGDSHTATLLNDGRVLIVGGGRSAALFDPGQE